MSIVRVGVSSLLNVAFLATFAGLGVALEAQEPRQTQRQIEAAEALTQGVEAFKNGQTDEATRLFEHAKQLDPGLLNARLYLATAWASRYIPGAPGEENKRLGQQAIQGFKEVLQFDPQNLKAIDGIGSLLFQMAGTSPVDPKLFKESKSFHEKHIQIKPEDPEPYYWIGVIEWTLAFRANNELRSSYNKNAGEEQLKDDESLPPYLQVAYANEWGPTIDDGIASMKKAIALKPDYDDAMAYLSLFYRRKADAVAAQFERDQLTEMADDLIDRIKEIKERKINSQPN